MRKDRAEAWRPAQTAGPWPVSLRLASIGILWGSLGVSAGVWAGCGADTYLHTVTPTPMVTPIPVSDPESNPPDWTTCVEGYSGYYYNLPASHPDVEPEEDLAPGTLPTALDWWDETGLAFVRYDSSLDFGLGWYPVEQGFEGDPDYFAVHWQGWMRVKNNNTTVTFSLAAATDLWVQVGEEVIALTGVQDFDVQDYALVLNANQYPLEVYFAQRAQPSSGLRVKISGQDVRMCYPEYE